MTDEQFNELAGLLSETAGQQAALTAVVLAICEQADPASPLAAAILAHLERSYSDNLQKSMNQPFFDGFESLMDLASLALRSEPAN